MTTLMHSGSIYDYWDDDTGYVGYEECDGCGLQKPRDELKFVLSEQEGEEILECRTCRAEGY